MAFSPLLGLLQPTTGSLTGTWGSAVNTQITALIDSAIAGTTTLSADSDVTLTATDGAANQARQAVLLCSGARTALRTITAPAQSKVYVVVNNTTGGYGVQLVGAGPTTGVTVENGTAAVVVWDGSDFMTISETTLADKVISNATFTDGYTEESTTANSGSAYTIDLDNGTIQFITLTDDCTFTFPSPTAGKSFSLFLIQDGTGSRTATWPASVKWPYSLTPTLTATATKTDRFTFTADGTNWFGASAGQSY